MADPTFFKSDPDPILKKNSDSDTYPDARFIPDTTLRFIKGNLQIRICFIGSGSNSKEKSDPDPYYRFIPDTTRAI